MTMCVLLCSQQHNHPDTQQNKMSRATPKGAALLRRQYGIRYYPWLFISPMSC